jgi:general secretion pathway protein D
VFATQQVRHVVRVPRGQTAFLKLGAAADGGQQYVLLTPCVQRRSEEAARPAEDEPASRPERSRRNPYPRVFPVGDLLVPVTPAPQTDGVKGAPASSAGGARADGLAPVQTLLELIRTSIAPSTWQEKGGEGAISYYPLGQAVVVWHRGEVQDEVDGLLRGMRRLRSVRISLDCRLVELSDAAAQRVAVGRMPAAQTSPPAAASRAKSAEEQDLTGPPEAGLTKAVAPGAKPRSLLPPAKTLLWLNSDDALELRRLLAAHGPAVEHVLGAVTFNGCRVRMDKTRPYTYTTDVNVGLEDGRIVVKPRTSTVRLGTVIEALPVATADGAGLSLEINVEHTTLSSADAQMVRVGVGEETQFALGAPPLSVTGIKTVVDLAKTETLVLPLGAVLVETRQEYGAPHLARIPYVNRLFRNVGYGRETRHLYVTITPQIHER